MAWKVEFSKTANKQFAKLDRAVQLRVTDFIDNRLSLIGNPRSLGQALTGARLGDLWRFRVGDYRLVCDIQDNRLIVLVVDLGHRSQIYR